MSAVNSKVVQITQSNGDMSKYVKVSARIPEFLKAYGPDKGYRVLSTATDYLDFTQGRKDLYLALAAQGSLPDENLKELFAERKIVFRAQLVDKEGVVIAESSALKPIWNHKDYESGETAAFQRLIARLGFGGEVFDSDEENDIESQNLTFDVVSDEPGSNETVTMKPVAVNQPHPAKLTAAPVVTKTDSPTVQSEPATPPVNKVESNSSSRGLRPDPNVIHPAQRRQLMSMARVRKIECPEVNTVEEFRIAFAKLKQIPVP